MILTATVFLTQRWDYCLYFLDTGCAFLFFMVLFVFVCRRLSALWSKWWVWLSTWVGMCQNSSRWVVYSLPNTNPTRQIVNISKCHLSNMLHQRDAIELLCQVSRVILHVMSRVTFLAVDPARHDGGDWLWFGRSGVVGGVEEGRSYHHPPPRPTRPRHGTTFF